MAALKKFAPEFHAAHAAMLLLSARVLSADRGATLRRLKQIVNDGPSKRIARVRK
jgi:hypothetical protein